MNQLPKRLPYGLVVALVVATAATTPADPPALEAKPPAESQFLLFAFENLLNDGWPEARLAIVQDQFKQDRVRVVKDGKVDGQGVPPKEQFPVVMPEKVRAFVAERERVVHDLVDHVKELNLGDKQKNKDLVEQLELYMKTLREHGEKLAAALDGCDEELARKQNAILQAVDRDAAPKKLDAARHVLATAQFMSRATDDSFTAVFVTALVGMAEDARIKGDIVIEAQKRFMTYLKDQGGLSKYSKASKKVADDELKTLRGDLKAHRDAARKLAEDLQAQHKWDDAETPFVAPADAGRSADLLTQGLRLDPDEQVETSMGDSAEAESRLARAVKYAKLAALVPASKNKANNYYRSDFYYRAGLDANRAAALTVDTDGFSAAKICPAAKQSMKYWSEYKKNSDRDLTGDTLHNYCLAFAYNHQAIAAFEVLKVDSKFFPQEPGFYYDQARMCSVAAEEYAVEIARNPGKNLIERGEQQKQLHQMFQRSSLSLDRAVLCGFKDFERAKTVRDLKALREAEAGLVAPRRTFEQIVGQQ